MKFKIIVLMLFSTGLISCSEPQSDTDQVKSEEKNSPQEHILSDQQRMLQKAKETEEAMKKAQEKRRKAIEDQSG